MKKLFALILATATLLALLSGCGQKDSTGDGGSNDGDSASRAALLLLKSMATL